MKRYAIATLLLTAVVLASPAALAADADSPDVLTLHVRSRVEHPVSSGQFKIVYETLRWDPRKTAVIICDMWDTLCCKIPADRVAEMAPRMNEVVAAARKKGVLIVHAPSGNVDFYKDTPQRKLALQAPKVETKVPLKGWCYLDKDREPALPIDDSDNGWEGPRLPGRPQTRQHEAIKIEEGDAVDASMQVYYLIQQRGIENVILMGVHTNMCVLGRPFGIRQLVYQGKNVVLMRDMTDSLYNPKRKPYVSHFRGTEMVIEHIEKYWCPTVTSTDLLGKPAFRFKGDTRPHVALIVSDDHYGADKTLPVFAQMLRRRYECYATVLHGQGTSDIPHTEELEAADCLVLFIRRLALPGKQLDRIRAYLDAGKPLIGLRTSSHAFDVHGKAKPGQSEWPEFDAAVQGGNYHGHGPNPLGTDVTNVPEAADHPILAGVKPDKWHSTGSLYYTAPIDPGATLLMTGSIQDRVEPLTWTRTYKKARVFYSALGHPDDFKEPQFRKLLVNAVYWSMDRPVPKAAGPATPDN